MPLTVPGVLPLASALTAPPRVQVFVPGAAVPAPGKTLMARYSAPMAVWDTAKAPVKVEGSALGNATMSLSTDPATAMFAVAPLRRKPPRASLAVALKKPVLLTTMLEAFG